MTLHRVRYSANSYQVYSWLEDNCESEFYTGTDWSPSNWDIGGNNKMIEFVSERDAIAFALRWA